MARSAARSFGSDYATHRSEPLLSLTTTPSLIFDRDRPFFEPVMSFLAATIGMGPVFDKANPLALSPDKIALYHGRIQPAATIDTWQIYQECSSGAFTADVAVRALCCMLLNSAYELARTHNDNSAEFELFRHVRNAASHGNRFHFTRTEPVRPASFGSLVLDASLKGKANPFSGV